MWPKPGPYSYSFPCSLVLVRGNFKYRKFIKTSRNNFKGFTAQKENEFRFLLLPYPKDYKGLLNSGDSIIHSLIFHWQYNGLPLLFHKYTPSLLFQQEHIQIPHPLP